MGEHPTWAARAVEEAMDVPVSVARLRNLFERVAADGVLTGHELGLMRGHLERLAHEAHESVHYASVTELSQRISAAALTGTPLAPYHRKQAAALGLEVAVIAPPPTPLHEAFDPEAA